MNLEYDNNLFSKPISIVKNEEENLQQPRLYSKICIYDIVTNKIELEDSFNHQHIIMMGLQFMLLQHTNGTITFDMWEK